MINIAEIKEALAKMSDTEIIYDLEDEKNNRLKFRKNGDLFTMFPLPENEISKTNLRLSRFIRLPKNTKITKDEGELIEASVNLTSSTPCKVAYIYSEKNHDLDNSFFITNVYTDKLDQFEKFNNEKMKISNIVILILCMIVEIISCHQDISLQADEAAAKRIREGAENGK